MSTYTCVGRLGRDPEIKDVKGSKVATFSIAVDQQGKDLPPIWWNVEAWNRQAEFIEKGVENGWIKKGKPFSFTTKLKQDNWEDKDSGEPRSALKLEILDIAFLPSNKQESNDGDAEASRPTRGAAKGKSTPRRPQPEPEDDNEDNIPF